MMKNIFLLILLAATLVSCSSRKHARKSNRYPAKTTSPRPQNRGNGEVIVGRSSTNQLQQVYSTNGYIERFKEIAVSEMRRSGIPASITLAQGMLESANGNSLLAREANNHFGIKSHNGWMGKSYIMDDDAPSERFRVYDSAEDSYHDHSEFLKRQRYAFLFELDRNDYRGWAHGLKKAGYATNPKYPDLLISLIERYGLQRFDSPESYVAKVEREETVQAQIVVKEKQEEAGTVPVATKAPVAMKIYEVIAGDTLYSISKKFGLSVDDLRILNSLQSNNLQPGQLLLVSK